MSWLTKKLEIRALTIILLLVSVCLLTSLSCGMAHKRRVEEMKDQFVETLSTSIWSKITLSQYEYTSVNIDENICYMLYESIMQTKECLEDGISFFGSQFQDNMYSPDLALKVLELKQDLNKLKVRLYNYWHSALNGSLSEKDIAWLVNYSVYVEALIEDMCPTIEEKGIGNLQQEDMFKSAIYNPLRSFLDSAR